MVWLPACYIWLIEKPGQKSGFFCYTSMQISGRCNGSVACVANLLPTTGDAPFYIPFRSKGESAAPKTLSAMALPINLLVSLLFPLSMALFHHGWANYDQTKELDYTGVVKEMTYENPHGLLKLEHEGKTWTVVLAPTSRMTDRGLTADMIAQDDTVRVVGYPHKEEADEMRAERIFVGDSKYELR